MSALDESRPQESARDGAGPAGPVPDASPRPRLGWVWAAVAWTAFVWVGRIRNALGDPDLSGAALARVIAVSVAFLVLAAVVAGLAVAARRPGSRARRVIRPVVLVTFLATCAVWVVRIADIALDGSHDAAFVAVHTVLGVGLMALWGAALLGVNRLREKIPREN